MSKAKIAHLGKIGEARLGSVPPLEGCNPGLKPIEYNVVLALAPAQKTIGSLGIVIAPDETKDTAQLAMQVGRIIAVSPLAFDYAVWPPGISKPVAGDLVWFARYAGALFEGLDGREYRIVKDKDIGAVIEQEASHGAA